MATALLKYDDTTMLVKVRRLATRTSQFHVRKLRLNSQKCDAPVITRKHSPLGYTYCIDDSPISWKSIDYIREFTNSTLNWTDHIQITVAKATRQLNLLRHSLWGYFSLISQVTTH